eukprot:TRINITY_DN542418_c0_g2_i1.p1 TRINITY_DN542418_c0_g2~~TRINITY_DN542418_c0_g2_i1.p1  ORF type:complete len:144 (+),score=2.33 TRINITY_DN542418_c0_g2_i1:36-434(+)
MVPTKQPVWSFKIGDLGIANQPCLINQQHTTLAWTICPPEFLRQEFGAISFATDIYHFGLILLQLVSGTPLFFETEQILAGEPRVMAENLSSPYAEVISMALRRHSWTRFQTPAQMWEAIRQVAFTQQGSTI